MPRVIKAASLTDAMKQMAEHEVDAAQAMMSLDTAINRIRTLLDVYRVAEQTQKVAMVRTMGTSRHQMHQLAHRIYTQVVIDLERDIEHLMDAHKKVIAALGGAGDDL